MSERMKKTTINSIIFILAYVFFKITSNLDNIEIVIFLILLGILFISIKSKKKRIRYIWGGGWLISCTFFSILAYFPLFENTPNIDEFINTQTRHIQVNSNTSKSTLIIKQLWFTKKQEIINTKKDIIIKESPNTTITFTNEKWQNNSNMTIQFWDQTTVYIYPNTTFSLNTSWSQQIIENINGEMEYIQWTGNKTIIKNANLKKISDFPAKWLWNTYKENLREYMIKSAWWRIMENESIRKISHNMVVLGSKIRPNKYLPYLENEKKYTEILGWTTNTKTQYKEENSLIERNIIENAKLGWSKTRFLNIFNNNE